MKKYYEAYDQRYRQAHARGITLASNTPSPIVEQTLRRLALPPEARLLELGCGEGRDAAALLAQGYDLLATDVSPAAIAFCQAKYPAWAARFAVLDCLTGTLPGRFDFIYAIAVLHMLVLDEDRCRFLAFIREHLAPSGAALLAVMGDGREAFATEPTRAFDLQPRSNNAAGLELCVAATSCRMVTAADFRQELEAAAFHVEALAPCSIPPDFPTAMYAVIRPLAE